MNSNSYKAIKMGADLHKASIYQQYLAITLIFLFKSTVIVALARETQSLLLGLNPKKKCLEKCLSLISDKHNQLPSSYLLWGMQCHHHRFSYQQGSRDMQPVPSRLPV